MPRSRVRLRILLVVVTMAACRSHPAKTPEGTAPQPAPVPAKAAVDSARAINRRGIPRGFIGIADDGNKAEGANYRENGGEWEVSTGPSHIMYSPADTTPAVFTVATTYDQLEARDNSDGFGLFIGGTDLGTPATRYTSFMVRGTGEFAIRVREGGMTREIVGWTRSDAVMKQDATGWGRYRIAIQARADSVRFLVSGRPVAAVKADVVPTRGLAGFRISRNSRVMVDHIRLST